jgi:iron complex transport system ATP-binding protein
VSAIRIHDLVVELGGRRILDGIDLDLDPGAWVSIVGPNGAGKTTLVRALAGMVRPTTGSIELGGVPVRALRARARARALAVVPQTPVIPAGVSVLDYALLGRTPYVSYFGRETARDVDACRDMLDRLGIATLATRSVETLSGGERQRVVLARALLQGAPIVALDEPTTALDIGHQQDVLELVEELRDERGLTVVSTMHDLTLAGLFADELVLLDAGRIAQRGPAEVVLTEAHLREHFGARVTVMAGRDGPVVVPARLGRRQRDPGTARSAPRGGEHARGSAR